MASKNDLNDAKNNTQTQQQSSNTSFTGQQDQSQQKGNEQYATANARGGAAWTAAQNLNSTGSLAPAAQATASQMQGMGAAPGAAQIDAGNLASTGGVDMNALSATNPAYQQISSGASPDVSTMRNMESSGGLSAADKNNYLGGGVYQNMAQTGGMTPAQQNTYMQQATATVPAMYSQMANTMAQRRAVQGGYSPGFDSSMGLLGRQQSQDMSAATLNAQNSLNTTLNSNKLAGAQGLQTGQGAFSALQTGNQLAGANSANTAVMGSLNAQQQAAQQAQALKQQGMIAGAGLETSQGNTAAQNQQAVMGAQNSNMIGGLSAMDNLYGTNVQAGETYAGQNLSGIQGQAGANDAYENTLNTNAATNPGVMGTIASGVGMAGGLLTGLSPYVNKPATPTGGV